MGQPPRRSARERSTNSGTFQQGPNVPEGSRPICFGVSTFDYDGLYVLFAKRLSVDTTSM